MSDYHQPVLLDDSVSYLVSDSSGVYVDVTYGGGGHSEAVLSRLSADGALFAFDQDVDSHDNIINDERLIFIRANFSHLSRFMDYYHIDGVDGVLADLGVSSHHFDEQERGFSYRFDATLDMRMNQSSDMTAADIINSYSQEGLQNVFSRYGEVRNSKTLAKAIVQQRLSDKITTVASLLDILDKVYRGDKMRYCAQVFQALRIEVNDEFGVLERVLVDSMNLLKPGGRLVVISYHSLEDKIVKRFFRDNNFDGVRLEDEYGRLKNKLKPMFSKPILPGREEVLGNSRAASAKLRVAVKL